MWGGVTLLGVPRTQSQGLQCHAHWWSGSQEGSTWPESDGTVMRERSTVPPGPAPSLGLGSIILDVHHSHNSMKAAGAVGHRRWGWRSEGGLPWPRSTWLPALCQDLVQVSSGRAVRGARPHGPAALHLPTWGLPPGADGALGLTPRSHPRTSAATSWPFVAMSWLPLPNTNMAAVATFLPLSQ